MVYHKKTMKQESVTKALLFREFKHFTSSPGYMLYIVIFIAVNVVAGLTLYIWLKTKGCDRFAEL